MKSLSNNMRMHSVEQTPCNSLKAKNPGKVSHFGFCHFITIAALFFTALVSVHSIGVSEDLRSSILAGTQTCIQYSTIFRTFTLQCDMAWSANFTQSTYITLLPNERFDGHGYKINLVGVTELDGLFRVNDSSMLAIDQAVRINAVHTIGGSTAVGGGFIVQAGQSNFEVDQCSSSGDIMNAAGGICGSRCGHNGPIRIRGSSSYGNIIGIAAGGIIGRNAANGTWAFAEIDQCFSVGAVLGDNAGGLCGSLAGSNGGNVRISQSYSTGNISGTFAGGILASGAGFQGGTVNVTECYSVGEINGGSSGGIFGARAATSDGQVNVRNSYSRGNVYENGGGIFGTGTGAASGTIHIENVFASGTVIEPTSGGGIFGSVALNVEVVRIRFSLYNGIPPDQQTGNTINLAGMGTSNKIMSIEGVSDDLENIRGQLYVFNNAQRWSESEWALNGTQNLPILRFQIPNGHPLKDGDLRNSILEGQETCLQRNAVANVFEMTCDIVWSQIYNSSAFITLLQNEVFEGRGHTIDLTGVSNFHGLFRIDETNISTIDQQIVIRDIHAKGGKINVGGGFIVQSDQSYFHIERCSSTGVIEQEGGGICGASCGSNGPVLIRQSASYGEIRGDRSGGIVGREAASGMSGFVGIENCFSVGAIMGESAGGICGFEVGRAGGTIRVFQSYAEGKIEGNSAGGILGDSCGFSGGHVNVSECYSIGDIVGSSSGGIFGSKAALFNGKINVWDSYSTGHILTSSSGGIFGAEVAAENGVVKVENVFASGTVFQFTASGGIFGSISTGVQTVDIKFSLYNGVPTEQQRGNTISIAGMGTSNQVTSTKGVSDNLESIRGQLYVFNNAQRWPDSKWALNGTQDLPILRFQVPDESPRDVPLKGGDLRDSILEGQEPCIHFDNASNVFEMTCDILWSQKYTSGAFIRLFHGETFEGHGHVIDLNGVHVFDGLFRIDETDTESAAEVADIREINTKGGSTSFGGGFIVQIGQSNFRVERCSSTGIIEEQGGGICGAYCGSNGNIAIAESSSYGNIIGHSSGGIAGAEFASGEQGFAVIQRCFSVGTISGESAGGICGVKAGASGGTIYISRSYSKGGIDGRFAGGILGDSSGFSSGYIDVAECFSVGNINGSSTGGIVGSRAAYVNGEVLISDSYSMGDVLSTSSGGIFGSEVAAENGAVNTENVFSSGTVFQNTSSGGIFGSVATSVQTVGIKFSVYNGVHTKQQTGNTISVAGMATSDRITSIEGVSDNLENIRGQLYEFNNLQRWSESAWALNGTDKFPVLQFQVDGPEDVPLKGGDLRNVIVDGQERCIHFHNESNFFELQCDFVWTQIYTMDAFITLLEDEVFEGHGHVIDLSGVSTFAGLFRINEVNIVSKNQSVVIRGINTIGGSTKTGGGFIVQSGHAYFRIERCTSSGTVQQEGGGICGSNSGNSGPITIVESSSSGDIIGTGAGGIIGSTSSSGLSNSGVTHISDCSSSGNVLGVSAGGIGGSKLGQLGGSALVIRSFSTGIIRGNYAGGILGKYSGYIGGRITVSECYSIGDIDGDFSGGIFGSRAANSNGEVHIRDSYSIGNILSSSSGGIFGSETGNENGVVNVANVFASGTVFQSTASGGIFGSIAAQKQTVQVKFSVFNGVPPDQQPGNAIGIAGMGTSSKITSSEGISDNLEDIRGQLYTFNNTQRWSDSEWALNGTGNFPILRFQVSKKPPLRGGDLRGSILNGQQPCIQLSNVSNVFEMTCDIVWNELYNTSAFITLLKHEVFEGHGHEIDLSGISGFAGLFRIDQTNMESERQGVIIRDIHTKAGSTSIAGGFIVQEGQSYFFIERCSSSGTIQEEAGGICGAHCGGTGPIMIRESVSFGDIVGPRSGGIMGKDAGAGSVGLVEIFGCSSFGHVLGESAGGICGSEAGSYEGGLRVAQSFSQGRIDGEYAGGIIGKSAGYEYGSVNASECYTVGAINGYSSGGIFGAAAAAFNGQVHVRDSYSRGNIVSQASGGIFGSDTAEIGTLHVENVFASGTVFDSQSSGGIFGTFASVATEVRVRFSVYNGIPSNPASQETIRIAGFMEESITYLEGISDDLGDIQGQLYHFEGSQRWSNDIWVLNGTERFPLLAFQSHFSPTTTQSATPTTSPTRTMSATSNSSGTPTASESLTLSISMTASGSVTPTVTNTAASSLSGTASRSMSVTSSASPSTTSSSSMTPSSTSTPTGSVTETGTPTTTRTATATTSILGTSSVSATRSTSPTSTRSSSRKPSSTSTSTGSVTETGSPTTTRTATATTSISGTSSVSATRSTFPTSTRSSSMTPSASATSSGSVSGTRRSTTTASSSLTATGSWSATMSRSSTPTYTRSPPSSLTTTPSGSGSVTRSPTLTRTTSPTRSGTVSVTPTSTSSPTSSVTSSETARATFSPTPTLTPTVTPSHIPLNATLGEVISSACGSKSPFNCITALFRRFDSFRFDSAIINSSIVSVAATFSVQSVHNLPASASLECESLAAADSPDNVIYSGCQEQFRGTNLELPVPFAHRLVLVSNSSCSQSARVSASCRLLSYEVHLLFHPNASEYFRAQLPLIRERASENSRQLKSVPQLLIPLVIPASVEAETITSAYQSISVDITQILESTPLDVTLQPKELIIDEGRAGSGINTSNVVFRSVLLTLDANQRYSWSSASALDQIVILPSQGESGDIPVSLELKIGFNIEAASHGLLNSFIEVTVSDTDIDVSEVMRVDVSLRIREGNVELAQESVNLQMSFADPPRSLDVVLTNDGDYPVRWRARLFNSDGLEVPASASSYWVKPTTTQFPSTGGVSGLDAQQTVSSIMVDPKSLGSSGQVVAWLLVETDSRDGASQEFNEEPPSIPLSNYTGVVAWMRLNLLVTSVFVCPETTISVEVRPFREVNIQWEVVNVDSQPVLLLTRDFALILQPLNERNSTNSIVIDDLRSTVDDNVRHFSDWLQFSPASAVVSADSRRTFRASIGYPSDILRINQSGVSFDPFLYSATLRYSLSILTLQQWAVNPKFENSRDTRSLVVNMSFLSGPAIPDLSKIKPRSKTAFVNERIGVEVILADVFGNIPARAVFSKGDITSGELPLLEVTVDPKGTLTDSEIVITYPLRLQEGDETNGFEFFVSFKKQGATAVNLQLNGVPVLTSSVELQTETVRCPQNEVPNESGSQCLCMEGHVRQISRDDSGNSPPCSACPAGSFLDHPSNEKKCDSCPSNSFSLAGSSMCTSCLSEGFTCTQGRLFMNDGYWCEACAEGSSVVRNNKTLQGYLVEKIQNDKQIRLHECNPSSACIVNNTHFSTQCSGGRKGALCDACKDGFVKTEQECLACDDMVRSKAIVALWVVVAFAIVLAFNIHNSMVKLWKKNADPKESETTSSQVRDTRGTESLAMGNVDTNQDQETKESKSSDEDSQVISEAGNAEIDVNATSKNKSAKEPNQGKKSKKTFSAIPAGAAMGKAGSIQQQESEVSKNKRESSQAFEAENTERKSCVTHKNKSAKNEAEDKKKAPQEAETADESNIELIVMGKNESKQQEQKNDETATTDSATQKPLQDVGKMNQQVHHDSVSAESITVKGAMDPFKYLQLVVLFGLDYLQICSILGELKYTPFLGDAAWYSEFSRLFLMDPTQPDAFSCVSRFGFISMAVSSLLSPLLVIIASVLLQFLIFKIKKGQRVTWGGVLTSSLHPIDILLGQVHAAVTLTVINILNVYPYKVFGDRRLRADFSVTTEDEGYDALRVLAGISLGFVVLGFPVFLVCYLIYRHRTADTAILKKDFIRISSGLRIRNLGYLWPAVVILRKSILLLLAFFVNDPFEQVVIAMTVLLLFMLVGSVMRPYKLASPLNKMELAKSICLMATAGLGLIRQVVQDNPDEAEAVDYVVLLLQVVMAIVIFTGFVLIFPVALKTAVKKVKAFIEGRKNKEQVPETQPKRKWWQRCSRPGARSDNLQTEQQGNSVKEDIVIEQDSSE